MYRLCCRTDRRAHKGHIPYITSSDGSKDVNVRSGDIKRDCGYRTLSEGQLVEFEVSDGPQGLQAKNVRVQE